MTSLEHRLEELLKENTAIKEGLKLALEKEEVALAKGINPPAWTAYEVGLIAQQQLLLAMGVVKVVGRSKKGELLVFKNREMVKRVLYRIEPPPPKPEVELPPDLFDNIVDYEDLKKAFIKALTAPKPVHILLVGPPASATGDTEVIVKNKQGNIEIVRLEELYRRWKRGESFLALSVNPRTLKTEWKLVIRVIKHGFKPVVRVKLRGGREVKVTRDHSLFRISYEGLKPMKVGELKVKIDSVAVVYRIPLPENLKKWRNIALDSRLGFATGLWLADGSIYEYRKDGKVEHIVEITNTDQCLIEKFTEGIRLLDPNYTPRGISQRRFSRRTYRKAIYDYFIQFVNGNYYREKGKGRSSRNKFLPSWVFASSKDFKINLIKGFFKGDARKKEPYFTISSRKLRDGIALLLMGFGIPFTLRDNVRGKYYGLRILAPYAHVIGYERGKTIIVHDEIFRVPVPEFHIRRGLLSWSLAEKLYKHLGKILAGDVFCAIVENIEDCGIEEVYDISVNENENFVTKDGIVLHNSAKSLFLEEIERLPGSVFITAGTSTRAGIREIIFQQLPRYLLIDELDKVNDAKDLSALLTWMESGRIVRADWRGRVEKRGKGWVFAAANREERIPWEIRSRFLIFRLREYTREEYIEIAKTVLVRRENVPPDLAEYIARRVSEFSRNVRDAVKVGRMARTKEEVDEVVEILKRRS